MLPPSVPTNNLFLFFSRYREEIVFSLPSRLIVCFIVMVLPSICHNCKLLSELCVTSLPCPKTKNYQLNDKQSTQSSILCCEFKLKHFVIFFVPGIHKMPMKPISSRSSWPMISTPGLPKTLT